MNIFITGGTSGLGLELVKLFVKEGNKVVTTGRQQFNIKELRDNVKLYQVDFSNLGEVAITMNEICKTYSFDIIINNAGILSPPQYTPTINGLEYTFQVNYLSHLLIDEIILHKIKTELPLLIATVTSPVYRLADTAIILNPGTQKYNALKTYASSKLYLTLMGEILQLKHSHLNLLCISFDPGTFSSGIYRMQNKWFRGAYRIASRFMRSPARVAKILSELLMKGSLENGMIYDISKRSVTVPSVIQSRKDIFIRESYDMIDPYLKSQNN